MAEISHRTGTGFIKSCYNASAAFLGIGILTLPYGLSQGGWLSLILLSVIASMSFFTAVLLKKCLESENSLSSYQDIGEHAFGRKGRIAASLVANLELYLVATSLLVMEGESLHRLFPNYNFEFGNLVSIGGKQCFIVLTPVVILPTVFVTSLTKLSYVSAVGMLAIIVLVVSVFAVGLVGKVGFHGDGKLLTVNGVSKSICLFTACFGGHSVIPTLYKSMRNKDHFSKVMFVSLLFTGIIYISMAIIGYLMYGGRVDSQIILNLPATQLSSKVAIYATLVIPITRYALVMIPVASAIESIGPLQKYSDNNIIRNLIRTILLISTTLVACSFPYFESLMALIGSMFVVSVSFLLPCGCYLKISGAYKKLNKELAVTISTILFGGFAGIIGTNSSVREFIHKF